MWMIASGIVTLTGTGVNSARQIIPWPCDCDLSHRKHGCNLLSHPVALNSSLLREPNVGGIHLDEWPPVSLVSVIATGAIGALFALGWALPKILHALAEMIALIVTASTTGVITAAPIAAWVAPVASAGIAAAGAGTVIVVLVK